MLHYIQLIVLLSLYLFNNFVLFTWSDSDDYNNRDDLNYHCNRLDQTRINKINYNIYYLFEITIFGLLLVKKWSQMIQTKYHKENKFFRMKWL